MLRQHIIHHIGRAPKVSFPLAGTVGRQGYIHALNPQAHGPVERVPTRHMEEPYEVGDFFAACLYSVIALVVLEAWRSYYGPCGRC